MPIHDKVMLMNDVIFIGAGPVGLYGAYLAGLRGLKGIVLESLPMVGGQLTTLYPEKSIYDLPGFVDIKASTFIDQLYTQYARFKDVFPIHVSTSVSSLTREIDGSYQVHTLDGKRFHTRFVVFTSGIGLMTPKRLEDTFAPHPRIQYQLDDVNSYKDQDILILGGGNTALDYANSVLPFASSVTLVHRREVFKAFQASLHTFKDQGGQVLVPYHLDSYRALDKGLEVRLISETTQETFTRYVDRILVCYGYGTSLANTYHEDLTVAPKKLAFEPNKFIVNTHYETSLPHVYAAGDAITYEGKASHLAQGFGEVTTIMEIIHHACFPSQKLPHSSFMTLK